VKSIALDRFPEARADWKNIKARDEVAWIQEVVTALRTIRAELKLDPKKRCWQSSRRRMPLLEIDTG